MNQRNTQNILPVEDFILDNIDIKSCDIHLEINLFLLRINKITSDLKLISTTKKALLDTDSPLYAKIQKKRTEVLSIIEACELWHELGYFIDRGKINNIEELNKLKDLEWKLNITESIQKILQKIYNTFLKECNIEVLEIAFSKIKNIWKLYKNPGAYCIYLSRCPLEILNSSFEWFIKDIWEDEPCYRIYLKRCNHNKIESVYSYMIKQWFNCSRIHEIYLERFSGKALNKAFNKIIWERDIDIDINTLAIYLEKCDMNILNNIFIKYRDYWYNSRIYRIYINRILDSDEPIKIYLDILRHYPIFNQDVIFILEKRFIQLFGKIEILEKDLDKILARHLKYKISNTVFYGYYLNNATLHGINLLLNTQDEIYLPISFREKILKIKKKFTDKKQEQTKKKRQEKSFKQMNKKLKEINEIEKFESILNDLEKQDFCNEYTYAIYLNKCPIDTLEKRFPWILNIFKEKWWNPQVIYNIYLNKCSIDILEKRFPWILSIFKENWWDLQITYNIYLKRSNIHTYMDDIFVEATSNQDVDDIWIYKIYLRKCPESYIPDLFEKLKEKLTPTLSKIFIKYWNIENVDYYMEEILNFNIPLSIWLWKLYLSRKWSSNISDNVVDFFLESWYDIIYDNELCKYLI